MEVEQGGRKIQRARSDTMLQDCTSTTERRMPEADRRHEAEHERLARAMDGHATDMAETSQGVITRLAAWMERHLAGVLRQREASEAVGRR